MRTEKRTRRAHLRMRTPRSLFPDNTYANSGCCRVAVRRGVWPMEVRTGMNTLKTTGMYFVAVLVARSPQFLRCSCPYRHCHATGTGTPACRLALERSTTAAKRSRVRLRLGDKRPILARRTRNWCICRVRPHIGHAKINASNSDLRGSPWAPILTKGLL
jgi:hypothetical protein